MSEEKKGWWYRWRKRVAMEKFDLVEPGPPPKKFDLATAEEVLRAVLEKSSGPLNPDSLQAIRYSMGLVGIEDTFDAESNRTLAMLAGEKARAEALRDDLLRQIAALERDAHAYERKHARVAETAAMFGAKVATEQASI